MRQIRSEPLGIRTGLLICLSTQIFVSLGHAFAGENEDATRVLGQVVTGVGFLGRGVILAREGVVTGVTTAALIWTLAAIGAVIGFGELRAGVAIAIVVVATVTGIELLESSIRGLRRGVHARQRNTGPSSPTAEPETPARP